MKLNIGKNEIDFDMRKESLLISVLCQKLKSNDVLERKINKQVKEFIDLAPKMRPKHIVVTRWHSGYELGFPNDYYGIGAISCDTIKPWKSKFVDHLIQNKNPFKKILNPKLLNQITFDYKNISAMILEGNDSFSNYYFLDEIYNQIKKIGFSINLKQLENWENVSLGNFINFEVD